MSKQVLYMGGDVSGARDDGMDVVNLMHGREDVPGMEVGRCLLLTADFPRFSYRYLLLRLIIKTAVFFYTNTGTNKQQLQSGLFALQYNRQEGSGGRMVPWTHADHSEAQRTISNCYCGIRPFDKRV